MKLFIALTLTLGLASASIAHADYSYKCTNFGSPDTYQLEIDEMMAMITTQFSGTYMGTSQNDGVYNFNGMMEIGNYMFMQPVLSVPQGMIGASWLRATVTDNGSAANETELDCTLQ